MIPQGSVSTPFTWLYFNEEFPMYFYAGFVGVTTLALRPMIGWAVVDKEIRDQCSLVPRLFPPKRLVSFPDLCFLARWRGKITVW